MVTGVDRNQAGTLPFVAEVASFGSHSKSEPHHPFHTSAYVEFCTATVTVSAGASTGIDIANFVVLSECGSCDARYQDCQGKKPFPHHTLRLLITLVR